MKQQKPLLEKEDSSLKGLLRVAVVGFVVLALFLMFASKSTTPKIAPEVPNKTALVCSEEYYPVCGKDGKTYANSCTAEKIADVRVAYVGECRDATASGATKEATLTQAGTESNTGTESPAIVPKEIVTPENTGSTEPVGTEVVPSTETPSVPVVLSGATDSASGVIDPSLSTYSNATYRYSFSMPKSSYYQAFGAQNGASHSVGISTGTGAESLANSQVRVYFYANKIVGKLAGAENGFYTDPATNTVYLLLNGKDSVAIESDSPDNKVVQTIIKTIHKD